MYVTLTISILNYSHLREDKELPVQTVIQQPPLYGEGIMKDSLCVMPVAFITNYTM